MSNKLIKLHDDENILVYNTIGTVTLGDVDITGDLDVQGTTTAVDTVISGPVTIDSNNGSAFVVEDDLGIGPAFLIDMSGTVPVLGFVGESGHVGTYDDTTGVHNANYFQTSIQPATDSDGTFRTFVGQIVTAGTANFTSPTPLTAMLYISTHGSSGDCVGITNEDLYVQNNSTGTLTDGKGARVSFGNNGGGTFTRATAFDGNIQAGSGAFGNVYMLGFETDFTTGGWLNVRETTLGIDGFIPMSSTSAGLTFTPTDLVDNDAGTDFGISLNQTLNDTQAAVGSEDFSLYKGGITATSTAGWATVNLLRMQTDAADVFTVSSGTFTTSGADDFGVEIVSTLNSGGASGSDQFSAIKTNIIPTDVSGWDQLNFFTHEYDSTVVIEQTWTNFHKGVSWANRAYAPAADKDAFQIVEYSGGGTAAANILAIFGGSGPTEWFQFGQTGRLTCAGTQMYVGTSTNDYTIAHNGTKGDIILTASGGGAVLVTQENASSGTDSCFTVTTGTHTLTSATEVPQVVFALSSEKTWATSTPATQREFLIQAPVYDCDTGSQTMVAPVTMSITGAPTAGSVNVDIQGGLALQIESGGTLFGGKVVHKQGTDAASANNLVLTGDGNVYELTGATNVQLISNLGWQDGAIIVLVANANVVIEDAVATSGTNITISLASAGNYSMTAEDTLTLVLCSTTANGQAWREISRTVM